MSIYFKKLFKFLHKDSLLLERRPIGKIEIIQNFEYQDAIDFYENRGAKIVDGWSIVHLSGDNLKNY